MDYGAALKKQHGNPNRQSRHYAKQSKFEGSLRQVRGSLIRALTAQPSQTYEELTQYAQADPTLFEKALTALIREGFVAEQDSIYTINQAETK